MKLEDRREETPFATRDTMLDIWQHITEFSYRSFGKKPRKMPKEPSNFNIWSDESKERWIHQQEELCKRQEYYDLKFIERETTVLDSLCRKIIFLIDGANELKPQYLFECDKQREMQDDAIQLCSNMNQELNHIMRTVPSNRNFIVKQQKEIDREIALLRGWRKSCNATRKDVLQKEIRRRKTAAEIEGFVFQPVELPKEAEGEESSK